jgi:ATP-binding cassette subfamily B multidrug efflux pump
MERGKKQKRAALGFILSYVKRHVISVAGGVVLLMAVDLIQLFIPRIVQKTVDLLGGQGFSYGLITRYSLYIVLLAGGMILIRFFWRVLIIGTSRKIEKEVRHDMFSHLQILSFSFFNRTKTGELMALMVNDVNAIRMATGPSFIALTDAVFMGTLSLVFMFSINVRVALLSIIPLPVIILMMARFGPMIQSRFRRVQESFASISSFVQESFSGIRTIKGFVQEKHEQRGFSERCNDYVDRNIDLIRVWGFFFPSITLLANLSLAILYLVGGRAVIGRVLTFGEFISLTMYINLLVWPVIAIGWVFTLLQRGVASGRRILDMLETVPGVSESEKADRAITDISGRVEFRDLTFRYPGAENDMLKGISAQVEPGGSLGIMGRSGSGKSTLFSLLFRLFPVAEGLIYIDGHEIHEISLPVLRGSIGYVPQDPFLFSDTVKGNLAFGLEEGEYDFDEMERVTKLCGIYEDIMGFSKGFDTPIGERGVTLSGGQLQRLSMARAMLVHPNILVLDDALSQVDASTEMQVLENLFSSDRETTLILASHRVSTVRRCDTIMVLDSGRVTQIGRHEDLLKESGFYSTVFDLQRLEEEIA